LEIHLKSIDSYVVRIYRRDGEALAGLVEHVRTSRTAAFRTLTELCEVLSGRRRLPRRTLRRFGAAAAADDHPTE
jgi:hypothetical protein